MFRKDVYCRYVAFNTGKTSKNKHVYNQKVTVILKASRRNIFLIDIYKSLCVRYIKSLSEFGVILSLIGYLKVLVNV